MNLDSRYIRVLFFIAFFLFAYYSPSFGQLPVIYQAEYPKDQNDISDANDIFALVGFAVVDANGLSTTTGGHDGDVVVVTTGEQLDAIMQEKKDPNFIHSYPPLTIIIEGTLTFHDKEMIDVNEMCNLSIFGAGTDAVIEGFGLNIKNSYNIIVRNIEFRDCPVDAINIEGTQTHHIWIDHCTFSDSPDVDFGASRQDGLLDIRKGASYITISWNHFYNHRKTCLLGHSDNNEEQDKGRLKVTYHHNWFDNTYSRHPRVRFGQCHVFNNYYDNSKGGMSYGIASTQQAEVVVEANFFKNVKHPMFSGYGSSGPGDIVEFNNIYENCGVPETWGDAFVPGLYYSYIPDDPADVPLLVTTLAGTGIIEIEIPTPIDY